MAKVDLPRMVSAASALNGKRTSDCPTFSTSEAHGNGRRRDEQYPGNVDEADVPVDSKSLGQLTMALPSVPRERLLHIPSGAPITLPVARSHSAPALLSATPLPHTLPVETCGDIFRAGPPNLGSLPRRPSFEGPQLPRCRGTVSWVPPQPWVSDTSSHPGDGISDLTSTADARPNSYNKRKHLLDKDEVEAGDYKLQRPYSRFAISGERCNPELAASQQYPDSHLPPLTSSAV